MTAAPAPNPLAGRSLRAPVLYGSLPLIEHDDRTVAPRLGRSQPPHVLNQLWPPGSRWILDQRRRIAVWEEAQLPGLAGTIHTALGHERGSEAEECVDTSACGYADIPLATR
jgi:hypothetical protein